MDSKATATSLTSYSSPSQPKFFLIFDDCAPIKSKKQLKREAKSNAKNFKHNKIDPALVKEAEIHIKNAKSYDNRVHKDAQLTKLLNNQRNMKP